jgi:methyl-accepting chemotaxis protein
MADKGKDLQQQLEKLVNELKVFAKDSDISSEADKEKIKQYEEEIKKLEKRRELLIESKEIIEEEEKVTGKLVKQSKELLGNLKNINTATGYMYNQIAAAGNEFREFLTNSKKQYALAEEMAKEYKKIGVEIGMTGKGAKFMENSFKGAMPAIAEMGMEASSLSTIFTEISDATGRMSNLTSEDAIRIASLTEAMDMQSNEAAQMADSFSLMGLSTEQMEKNILETYKEAQGMGLNATKVIKELQSNMKTMSTFSFANGVKGMTEMAKQAVKMRMDMAGMLQLADKLYQPDAAIEAAAELQLLGGDIAEAFGDPFTLMYEARNKPEELAKRISKMTENMLQFNEETGEYELPAEARMQFQALDKQLNLGVDNMIEMSRQAAKIGDIKMKFTSVGDDEMKESLASIAKFKDGKFVIETEEFGDLGLDQITDDMAETIMKEQQTSEESLRDIATNTKVMSEQIKNMQAGAEYKVAGLTNIYELTADEIAPVLQNMKDGIGNLADTFIDNSKSFIDDMFKNSGDEKSVLDDAMTEMDNLKNQIKDKVITSFGDLITSSKKLEETLNAVGGGSGRGNTGGADPFMKDFMVRSDGGVINFTNQDDIIGAKKGGPLDKLMDKSLSIPNNTSMASKIEFGKLDISGKIEITSPDGSSKNMDMESIKPQLIKTIISHLNGTFRNGGVPSSKETTDVM